ncbi:MAG: GNAT family N-acetyltransferase [Lachnospiraceae bacterium]|nr:GNAT family N-acetyltransferase [Lachnospiraceae bacterium]
MEYVTINADNFKWFKSLLPELYINRFCKETGMQGFGAVSEGVACGIILYTEDDKLKILHILYVSVGREYQNKGIGTDMLLTLSAAAYKNFYVPMAVFFAKGMEDPIYKLFDSSRKFTIEQRMERCISLKGKDVERVVKQNQKLMNKYKGKNIISYHDMDRDQKRRFYELISQHGYEDLLAKNEFSEDMSLAIISGDKIYSYILVSRLGDKNDYYIDYMYSTGENNQSIADLLISTFKVFYNNLRYEDNIHFGLVNRSVGAINAKFFDNANSVSNCYIAGYNGEYAI